MASDAYNATVTSKILLTPDLMILRVRTDEPRSKFKAGQFVRLGLFGKEPRSQNSAAPVKDAEPDKLIKRAYSIASADYDTLNFEFYISQIKSGQLTPRLFALEPGGRIWMDDRILGMFDINDTPDGVNIVMVATGTGLAPYISFLRSYIKDHQDKKLAVIHGAAKEWDLGYFTELTFLQNAFGNFYYFPTLVDPDPTWNGLTGYIEKHVEAGLLEKEAGIELNPDKTHVFLCGNPNMINSLTELLTKKGYVKSSKKVEGSLHVEKF